MNLYSYIDEQREARVARETHVDKAIETIMGYDTGTVVRAIVELSRRLEQDRGGVIPARASQVIQDSSLTAKAAATSPQDSPTKDMHTFKSGGKRSEVCNRYDLIPASFQDRLALRFTGKQTPTGPDGGALKYGEGNWEKGLPTSDLINHGLKHFSKLADAFRKLLTAGANCPIEATWEERMEAVRVNLRALLREDDDLAGAAWALATLSEQLETKFYHDERFEHAGHPQKLREERLEGAADPFFPGRMDSLSSLGEDRRSSPSDRSGISTTGGSSRSDQGRGPREGA